MPPRRSRGRRSYKPRRSAGRRPARAYKGKSRRYGRRMAKSGMPKRQTLQSGLGGLTVSRFVSSRRPNAVARTIKTAGSPNYINITYPGVQYGPGGKQQLNTWWLNCGNDLRRIWASIQAEYVSKNPTTTAERVTFTPGGNATPNQSFRYVLESAMSQLYLANTSGTPLNIELYDIVAKRDSPQLGLDASGNLLKSVAGTGAVMNSSILEPALAWFIGMGNQYTNATGFESDALYEGATPNNLGSTPYQSKLFKDYFKVVRKTNLSLPIGGQHKHFVDLKPNFVIDGDLLTQNNVFKGLSFFTLVVSSGVPVIACPSSDPAEPLRNPLGDASTSAVSLSIIQQVKYKWSWVEDSRENIYRANYINPLASDFQSTQPMNAKVSNCEVPANMTSVGQFTCQPSECTR